MGNTKSYMSTKLSGDSGKSKLKNSKWETLWKCIQLKNNGKGNIKEVQETPIPYDDPELSEVYRTRSGKIYVRRNVPEDDHCLLFTQTQLIKSLMKCKICSGHAQIQLDYFLKIVEDLRATGFKIDDKMLANLLLASLGPSYDGIMKEIESSKVKLTSKVVKQLIIDHADENIDWLYENYS